MRDLPRPPKALWPRLTGLKWMHSGSAGLEHLLFPDLISGPVVLTNARGESGRGQDVSGPVHPYMAQDVVTPTHGPGCGQTHSWPRMWSHPLMAQDVVLWSHPPMAQGVVKPTHPYECREEEKALDISVNMTLQK